MLSQITPYFPDSEEDNGSLLRKDLEKEMERFRTTART